MGKPGIRRETFCSPGSFSTNRRMSRQPILSKGPFLGLWGFLPPTKKPGASSDRISLLICSVSAVALRFFHSQFACHSASFRLVLQQNSSSAKLLYELQGSSFQQANVFIPKNICFLISSSFFNFFLQIPIFFKKAFFSSSWFARHSYFFETRENEINLCTSNALELGV